LLLQQYMDMAVASTPGEERPTLQVFAETPEFSLILFWLCWDLQRSFGTCWSSHNYPACR